MKRKRDYRNDQGYYFTVFSTSGRINQLIAIFIKGFKRQLKFSEQKYSLNLQSSRIIFSTCSNMSSLYFCILNIIELICKIVLFCLPNVFRNIFYCSFSMTKKIRSL